MYSQKILILLIMIACSAGASLHAAGDLGLYTETGIGVGYAPVGEKISADQNMGAVTNQHEKLGVASQLTLKLGAEVTRMFALEGILGMGAITSRRSDYVRDVALFSLMVGPRFQFEVLKDFFVTTAVHGGYAIATNAIVTSPGQLGLQADVGIRAQTRLRHVSWGIDLVVLATLPNVRAMAFVTPFLRYTF